jgi:ketosteroid isomerase-like protein
VEALQTRLVTPKEIDDLATAFFSAIERADTEALRGIYSDDATIWHNFDQVDQHRDANLKVLAWIGRNIADLAYTDIRRVIIDGGFIQQHVLRGKAPNGTELEVPAMLRISCEDGKVTRVEEYLDTAQVAALR